MSARGEKKRAVLPGWAHAINTHARFAYSAQDSGVSGQRRPWRSIGYFRGNCHRCAATERMLTITPR